MVMHIRLGAYSLEVSISWRRRDKDAAGAEEPITVQELADDFAKKRSDGTDRPLTALQRRMLSGGV